MADLSSPLAPRLEAAVPAERWLELASSDDPTIADTAADGLARLAIFSGDFALADPLLDLASEAARRAAFFAAEVLSAKGALPRLTARLVADRPAEPWLELAVLERLGDTSTRAELPPEPVVAESADEAARAVSDDLLDRAGGELSVLGLLHRAAGDELVPLALVEALRRRDAVDAATRLRSLLPTSTAGASPRDRAKAAALVATAHACLDALARDQPRKEQLDRLAIAAFLAGVRARARLTRDAHSALALAFLEGRDVTTLCATPPADPLPLLTALASAERLACDDAVVLATLGWRLEAAAPLVARVAMRRTFFWSFATSTRAASLDAALVAALREADATPGTVGVVAQLSSAGAEELALAVVSGRNPTLATYVPFLLHAFPTPSALAAARRTPPPSREELQERFEFVAALTADVEVPAPDAPVRHCLACGALAPVDGLRVVSAGAANLLDPPVPCPTCGALGDTLVHGEVSAAESFTHPLLGYLESPREALARQVDESEPSLLLADLADLAGEASVAEGLLQQVEPAERLASPLVAIRLLGRRQQPMAIRKLALDALALPPGVFFDDERAALERALAQASEELGLPVPPPPNHGRPTDLARELALALAKAGRNDPCPCGSGRKFKKCHGA